MADTLFRKQDRPVVISGPCSAETRNQTLETAKRLASTGVVDIIRAGIWKPRTRPGSFEGVGDIGLPWMQEVKKTTGLPVCVEVANAVHVDLALKYDIDIIWIGARTSVNPFAVQEIADAVRGIDIPVMVKNPINPDLSLWIGGIERILMADVKEVCAIHRGFSDVGEQYFRNKPLWQIPIQLRAEMPNIPIICDPSHICGRRDILADISQKAIDLGFDGLMLESHITPDDAWTDSFQQITPEVLADIINGLIAVNDGEENATYQNELSALRTNIDHIDEQILHLFESRMEKSRHIGEYKKLHNMIILQPKRWKTILNNALDFASKNNISDEFITKYLRVLHDESINQQEKVMRGGK